MTDFALLAIIAAGLYWYTTPARNVAQIAQPSGTLARIHDYTGQGRIRADSDDDVAMRARYVQSLFGADVHVEG